MFVLWKDYTAVEEAAEINTFCAELEVDYLKYVGVSILRNGYHQKSYIFHVPTKRSGKLPTPGWNIATGFPFYLPAVTIRPRLSAVGAQLATRLCGMHRSVACPPNEFLRSLDPTLDGLRHRLYTETLTSDRPAGFLYSEWADRLGLQTGILVAVGAFDAHKSAVGANIRPYHLTKIMGTSTCDILTAPMNEDEKLVRGICGRSTDP